MTQAHVAIVGAGLSGLQIARRLTSAGMSTRLFDKSRGVSGRIATRRIEIEGHTLRFDHGTPSLTESQAAQTRALSAPTPLTLDTWMSRPTKTGNEPHFSLAGGMNGIGKWLAQGQSITLNAPVTGLRGSTCGNAWQLVCESGLVPESFDLVITTTPPVPGAVRLLRVRAMERCMGITTPIIISISGNNKRHRSKRSNRGQSWSAQKEGRRNSP